MRACGCVDAALACGQFAVFVAFTCAFLAQMIYRIDSKWPVVARFDGRPRSALVTNSLACMSTVVLAVVLVWFGVALALVVVVVGCGAQPTRQTAKTAVRSSARSVPLGRSPAPVVPGITCALMYTCCEACVGVFAWRWCVDEQIFIGLLCFFALLHAAVDFCMGTSPSGRVLTPLCARWFSLAMD